MANEFYNAPIDIIPLTTARSANENSDRDSVEAGFDKLPTELDLKRSQFGVDSSTVATLYLITTTYNTGAYVIGQTISFEASFANTGPASITVNGGSNASIVDAEGHVLAAGAIAVGQLVAVAYTSTGNFQLLTASAAAAAYAATAAAAAIAATSAALLFNDVANHFYRNQ